MNWYQNFFLTGPIPTNAMYGVYDPYLVFLSFVIASMAAYVAFDMSVHLRKPMTLSFRIAWLLGGAFVMGAGIWSMHFVGMLAFIMPMQMSYSLYWTGLSMVVAIIAAAIAFMLFTIKKPQIKHYAISGIVLGVAILTMHYTGMAGMNDVKIHYEVGLFSLSIIIAIMAATAALWFAVQNDAGSFGRRARLKLMSALIAGFAIVGMHYTGMYAAVFTPTATVSAAFPLNPTIMAILISTIVMSIMIIALILSTFKYFIDLILKNKNDFLEAILNNMKGGVIACDAQGSLTLFNPTVSKIYGDMIKNKMALSEWISELPLFKANFLKKLKLNENPLYRALKGEDVRNIEVIAKDQKGKKHTLLVDGQQLRGAENENLGAVIVFNDISQRKKDEEALRHQATHDILTGLLNRSLLLDRLNQAIVAAKRDNSKITVIFIDLDFFKIINDALGHSIGDELLKKLRFDLSVFCELQIR